MEEQIMHLSKRVSEATEVIKTSNQQSSKISKKINQVTWVIAIVGMLSLLFEILVYFKIF